MRRLSRCLPSLFAFTLAGAAAFILPACGGEKAPLPAPDAARPVGRDPATWVPGFVASLPDALRRAALEEPVDALFQRAVSVRRLNRREGPSVQTLYLSGGAMFRLVGEAGLTEAGEKIAARLERVKEDGLTPEDFEVDELLLARKRFGQAREAFVAVPLPPAPTPEETQRIVALARTLPPSGQTGEAAEAAESAALLARLLAPDSPVPAWSQARAALKEPAALLNETRGRWELRLADGALFFARNMAHGNIRTEQRLARRTLGLVPAPAQATEEDGPGTQSERGGAGDDEAAPTPVSAPPGTALPPVLADPKAFVTERITEAVRAIKSGADADAFLTAAQPRHPQYVALKATLARYRAVGDEGFVEIVPKPKGKGAHPGFGPGASGPVVERLQKRLAQEGYYTGAPSSLFDDATTAALRKYQEGHGLEPTGRLNERTWEEIEIPLSRRVRSLDRALDNARRNGVDEDTYFVLVNIPDYHLEVWREGKRVMRNRVVVGKPNGTRCDEKTHRLTLAFATPRLSAEISSLVVAPYWNVTKDIKEKEYDPERAKDPLFYEHKGYEIMRAGEPREWVRQLPGPANSLGFVKILFPNEFAVYVHDTPSKSLFEKSFRAASHGCVRLDQPKQLAEMLLQNDGQWDPARFEKLYQDWLAMGHLLEPYRDGNYRTALRRATGLQTTMSLKEPVPIHLEYATSRVDDDGTVRFLQDIYGHDGFRWGPHNAPGCVPETQLARRGTEDIDDEIDHLEQQGAQLVKRLQKLDAAIERLSRGDDGAKTVARRARGLSTFADRHKTYVDNLRAANTRLQEGLEKRKGEWNRLLQDEAVKVRRLMEGLDRMNKTARKICDDAEKR